jgi:hypothetical protein
MNEAEIPASQRIIGILWPSFLTAAAATVVFFALFDPVELLAYTDFADSSRVGVYTVGFFLFWLLTTTSSTLTSYFQRPTRTPG